MGRTVRHSCTKIGDCMTDVVLLTGTTGFVGRQVLKGLGGYSALNRVVIREGTQS